MYIYILCIFNVHYISRLVHAYWASWEGWNDCSATCGGSGTRSRYRACNPPVYGGNWDCNSSGETEWGSCGTQPCPGNMIVFTAMLLLLSNLNTISYIYLRKLFKQFQLYPAVNCKWGQWSDWGFCSQPCGLTDRGVQSRYRSVIQQEANGGNECTGSSTESKYCNEFECPG